MVHFEQLLKIAEDGHGGPHAFAAQTPATERVLSQPDRPLELLEHFDTPVGQDLGDGHAQGVGPEVDSGDGLDPGVRFRRLFGRLHTLIVPSGGLRSRSAHRLFTAS